MDMNTAEAKHKHKIAIKVLLDFLTWGTRLQVAATRKIEEHGLSGGQLRAMSVVARAMRRWGFYIPAKGRTPTGNGG